VPDRILQVTAIPYTHSGKKVELAVKHALAGQQVSHFFCLLF
jgi:acyl-coenzyme A synthetase/AMP-(fatty) acid ligase